MKIIVHLRVFVVAGVIAGIFGSSVDWQVWQYWANNTANAAGNKSIGFCKERIVGIRQKLKSKSRGR